MIPTIIIVSLLFFSGGLKLSPYHPMLLHFVQMGIDEYLPVIGIAEISFALLFLVPKTSRLGLLLLTAYFGGAIAIEIPYQMMAGPTLPLALIWVAAYVRQPSLFIEKRISDVSVS